ncbi:MAG: sec-independent translocase [Actinopolymorphaceae bacterium]
MFDIGALEFVVLAVAALFIFGPDRLPDIARQAARGVRQVRNMAANARRELSRELGPEFEDLDIRDLNPRNFVRKHVLDDLDEDDLRIDRDLDIRDDLRVDDKPSRSKVNGSKKAATNASADQPDAETEGTDTLVDTAPAPEGEASEPATVPPFDSEAT